MKDSSKNPYRRLKDYCFWSRAVAEPAPWQVNPVTKGERITPGEKVGTMGSCFAQHLSRFISDAGLNYFVAEPAPDGMAATEAQRKNYSVFSARYGNVYTTRQALQLFQRAFGSFIPVETCWRRRERFVDPFRPQIDPDGFASPEEVFEETERHLASVRRVFLDSDWLVLTPGLTESWELKADGSALPLVPGAAGGIFDPERYCFRNFTIDEVRADLFELIDRLREVNPRLRIILTVSPVPLVATYEDRHVLVSTTASKSILRVAVDEAERIYEHVFYFPSYEIITSPAAGGRYFEDDLRQVRPIGVSHVMRSFATKFMAENSRGGVNAGVSRGQRTIRLKRDVICDEEILDSLKK